MLYDLLKNNTSFPGGYHGETMDLMLTNASANVARRAMRAMSEVYYKQGVPIKYLYVETIF